MHRSHVRVAFSKLHRLVNFGAEIWATYSNRRGLSFVINALTTQVTQTEYLGQSALHSVRFIFVPTTQVTWTEYLGQSALRHGRH